MQPTIFNCTRCHAPLTPGATQCANCGLTFDTPVPYSAPPSYAAPPQKKTSTFAVVAIVSAVGCLPVIAILAAILFPVFAKARDKARESASVSNMKQLSLATLQFAQDHDEKMPPLDTMDHFKSAVSPYLISYHGPDLFVQPGSQTPYALNAELSKKSLENIANPPMTVLMQENEPHSDGMIATAYADGHVSLTPAPMTDMPSVKDPR